MLNVLRLILETAEIDVFKAPITQDAFAARETQWLAPQRPGIGAGVEFAVLAAGITRRRQVVEQGCVELAAAERGIELLRVDATKDRAVTIGDEAVREVCRVLTP